MENLSAKPQNIFWSDAFVSVFIPDMRGIKDYIELEVNMSDFFKRVYEVVAQIPEGKVATYGQIAAILGNPKAARAVGWAMQAAPGNLNIPCHRVVNKSGRMAPAYAFGGVEEQQSLLKKEGVVFKEDGHIDMKQSVWELE